MRRAPGRAWIVAGTGGSCSSSTRSSSRSRRAGSAGSTGRGGGCWARRGATSSSASIPRKTALRAGDLDRASAPPEHQARLRRDVEPGASPPGTVETVVPTIRAPWDAFYANIAEALLGRAPLAVTAEQAREVVRVLEAAGQSARDHRTIDGPWGEPAGL